jgi:hypothetical protein
MQDSIADQNRLGVAHDKQLYLAHTASVQWNSRAFLSAVTKAGGSRLFARRRS